MDIVFFMVGVSFIGIKAMIGHGALGCLKS